MLLVAIISVLLVMGFYSVTDGTRLEHDQALNGADYVGYAVCHRITDRSFSIAGRQLPLCARCTGMYLGVSLTFAVLALAGRRRWSGMPPLKILLILFGLIGVMGIDGINSYSHFFANLPHLYEPHNWLRLVTGIGTGLAIGTIMFAALSQTLWREQVYRPALGNLRELAGLAILSTIAVGLVLSNQPTMLYVLGLVSAAGVLLILTAVNSSMLMILSKRDAQATSWRQASVLLAVGLLAATVQIAVISYLRLSLTGTMTGLPGL